MLPKVFELFHIEIAGLRRLRQRKLKLLMKRSIGRLSQGYISLDLNCTCKTGCVQSM